MHRFLVASARAQPPRKVMAVIDEANVAILNCSGALQSGDGAGRRPVWIQAKREAVVAGGRKPEGSGELVHFNARIEGINYDILDELVGYAVRRAQLSIYEDFAVSLGPEEITPQRFSSLVIIGSNPGISQTRLAEVMGIARSGVVSIIDRFEKDGYVERQASDDRRSYNLRLTREGQKQLKKYKKAVKEHDDRISRGLSEEERLQLRLLLRKLGQ